MSGHTIQEKRLHMEMNAWCRNVMRIYGWSEEEAVNYYHWIFIYSKLEDYLRPIMNEK